MDLLPGELGLDDATYDRLGLGAWTDAQLIAAVAAVVSRPKVAPATSFVLHAPLELLARALLLPPSVPTGATVPAAGCSRWRREYQAAGEERPDPAAVGLGRSTRRPGRSSPSWPPGRRSTTAPTA